MSDDPWDTPAHGAADRSPGPPESLGVALVRMLGQLLRAVAFVAGVLLAGAVGVAIYFGLFQFPGFAAIFNNKGSGPLGLLLFFVGFALGLPILVSWGFERRR